MNLLNAVAVALGLSRHEALNSHEVVQSSLFDRMVPYEPRNRPVRDRQYRKAQRKYRPHDRIDMRRMANLVRRDEAAYRARNGFSHGFNVDDHDRCEKSVTNREWRWVAAQANNDDADVALYANLMLDWRGR